MTFNKFNFLCILSACFIFSIPVSVIGSEDKSMVSATVMFEDNTIRRYEVDDTKIKIDTCVGKLSFPISRVSTIGILSGTDLMTVTLHSGEKWRSVADDEILNDICSDETKDDSELHGQIKSIAIRTSPEARCTPSHYMKLLLKDGSQAYLDSSELLLPVESESGQWDLPIGSAVALMFVSAPDSDTPEEALVRFPSRHTERVSLRSWRSSLTAKDYHGNRFRAQFSDIAGILSPSVIGSESLPSTTDHESHEALLTLKDGRRTKINMPLTSWEIKTKLGTILLPSPYVASISRDDESDKDVTIRTIYGEVFQGRWNTRSIRVENFSSNASEEIDVRDIKKLTASVTTQPIPTGWMVFYLREGLAVAGKFDRQNCTFINEEGTQVPSDALYSVTPTANNLFSIASRQGQVFLCDVITDQAELILLSNGMKLSTPWDSLYMAKSQATVFETTLTRMAADSLIIEQKEDSKEEITPTVSFIRSHQDVDEEVTLVKLPIANGSLKIEPDQIESIRVDKKANISCVATRHGDALIMSTPRHRWFVDLLADEDFEYPESDNFIIKVNPSGKSRPPSAHAFYIRLTTGSVLTGTLPPQSLTIRHQSSRKNIEFIASDIERITLDLDGNLKFQLKNIGNIVGRPKESELEFTLSATGEPYSIPFDSIEAMSQGISNLPPSTVFRPGTPPNLRNEILIEGGSFAQGNEEGMEDERPEHNVSVGSFYMDETEITRAQFAAFARETSYVTSAEIAGSATTWKAPGFIQRDDDPVVCLSWIDAAKFCNWRSEKTENTTCYSFNEYSVESDILASGYRLPTEAEWEFAARNRGQSINYPWGITSQPYHRLANYHQEDTETSDSWTWTNPVRLFPPNALGIYGLAGNVWEWCQDLYFDRAYAALQNRTVHNPCISHESAPSLSRRVMRGGSFRNELDLLRCSSRGNGIPYAYAPHVGFRCVRNAK